jgi:pyruvate carboxylase
VAKAYAEVNQLFGDIVKVTPTSKVVGDMALYMVANELTPEDVNNPDKAIDFPESVVSLMKGELGFPADGFPKALQTKVLKGKPPLKGRPGESIPAVDLEAARSEAENQKLYGDVSALPTPVFFYGLREQDDELSVDIEPGKTLVIRLQSRTDVEDEGVSKLFFELNGQGRVVRVPHAGAAKTAAERAKAEDGNASHIGAPMPGMVVRVAVQKGQSVTKGEPLLALEAMKMETVIAAPRDGVIKQIHVAPGITVGTRDLLIELEAG